MSKTRKLGRGLDALLGPGRRTATEAGLQETVAANEVPADALQPGRYQPRRKHSLENLAELAASIREQGVLQPLVVRPLQGGDSSACKFEIVAGERRWRAARIAGLATVPVIVRELDDQSALAVALIENLQREDLNPIDQASSLARLAEEFGLTHEQVAQAVGRSRASVSNLLRLLELQEDVKELLADGEIDMGHARALLPLDPKRQSAMARRACARGMSVRQVENAVRGLLQTDDGDPNAAFQPDTQTRWLQQQIAGELGQKISIRPDRDGNYSLRVGFRDLTQLLEALESIQRLVGRVRDTAGPRSRNAAK